MAPTKNAKIRKRREDDSRRYALTPGPRQFEKSGKLLESLGPGNAGSKVSPRAKGSVQSLTKRASKVL